MLEGDNVRKITLALHALIDSNKGKSYLPEVTEKGKVWKKINNSQERIISCPLFIRSFLLLSFRGLADFLARSYVFLNDWRQDDKAEHGEVEVGRAEDEPGAQNKTRIYHWLAGSYG